MNGERGTYAFPAARFRSNNVTAGRICFGPKAKQDGRDCDRSGFGAIQS